MWNAMYTSNWFPQLRVILDPRDNNPRVTTLGRAAKKTPRNGKRGGSLSALSHALGVKLSAEPLACKFYVLVVDP